MKIIVAGCGKVGIKIIEALVKEGHDVTIIDRDPNMVSEMANIYDVMGVCGNGADYDALNEAGAKDAELFIAVTGSDEFNMLSCFIARKMGAGHTIARIRNPEYNDKNLEFTRQQLNISMAINPEHMAAQELYNMLRLPSAASVEYFARRKFEMVVFKLRDDNKLDGLRLADARNKFNARFLVCAVQRNGDIIVPDGNFVLQAGDKIGVTATYGEYTKLMRETGTAQRQAKKVMILGGSRTAFYLAKRLSETGFSVKIIEQDIDKCDELSDLLSKVMIIHGDGAQQELLMEEGITSQDAFVALTGMDEENILMAIYAASKNVPKVIPKVNRAELNDMAEKLGVDSIISPSSLIADVVLRYARALENSMGTKIETMYKVMDGRAEAIEFIVGPDFPRLNVPLKNIHLKKNVLIAGIIRGKQTITPDGNDVIMDGDRIVIFSADHTIRKFADVFS